MRLLAGAAVAFGLIAILATLIGRGVTRPIRTLTESMEGLASAISIRRSRRPPTPKRSTA